MSNLGRYQDLTTLAKDVGGVDALLAQVRSKAVTRAAGPLIGTGLLTGIVLAEVGGAVWRRYQRSQRDGEKAEEALVARMGEPESDDETVDAGPSEEDKGSPDGP